MNLMTKKDFYLFVYEYLKQVEKHQIERVYFHFSCGYTEKEAKESKASLELIYYDHNVNESPWVWLTDWGEGRKFVCLYGVYKESDIIKILLDHYDSNTRSDNMNFEEAILEMITKNKKIKNTESGSAIAYAAIAYDPDRKKICFWHEKADEKGSHYGCEVIFTNADRVSNQWGVISDLPKNMVNCCTPAESLCTTCRNIFVCPMQSTAIVKSCEMYQKLPNPPEEIVTETRSLNQIKEENRMEAPELVEKEQAEIAQNAWKVRLIEEYRQLKDRYEKLKAYNNKQEVEAYLLKDVAEEPEDMYSRVLLKKQQSAMREYLHILELRAELAGIQL